MPQTLFNQRRVIDPTSAASWAMSTGLADVQKKTVNSLTMQAIKIREEPIEFGDKLQVLVHSQLTLKQAFSVMSCELLANRAHRPISVEDSKERTSGNEVTHGVPTRRLRQDPPMGRIMLWRWRLVPTRPSF